MLNDHIRYESGALWCEGVPLDAIAEAVGTPVYVYSAGRVLANVERVRRAFAEARPAIHYSIKANANLALLRLLGGAGLGMDAVSAGEIYRAQQAGIDPARIVFAGVGKTRDELVYALDAGVGWINVESLGELALLDALAGERGKVARVALRINPDIQAHTHRYLSTGHAGSKFGIPLGQVMEVLGQRADYPHLRIEGLHIHIGSQHGSLADLELAARAAALLVETSGIRMVDMGGGFPVQYVDSEPVPELERIAGIMTGILHDTSLVIEPGRVIVADAGVLVTSVLYVKTDGERRFVITDASMTELIRPALYGAIHPVVARRPGEGPVSPAVVAGPVCESADVLHQDARLPDLGSGDRLAVLGAGAYGLVMASNYNQRTRPPEVLVEGERWRVVRRRETWEDLLRCERDLEG